MNPTERLESIANSLSIPGARRHIFLCADQSNPRCAPVEVTSELWVHLKRRLKELGVTTPPPGWQGDPHSDPDPIEPGPGSILRTKADCLRICERGPVAVVYPDGTWYADLDEAKLDWIIVEHLIGGSPVDELSFARGDLS